VGARPVGNDRWDQREPASRRLKGCCSCRGGGGPISTHRSIQKNVVPSPISHVIHKVKKLNKIYLPQKSGGKKYPKSKISLPQFILHKKYLPQSCQPATWGVQNGVDVPKKANIRGGEEMVGKNLKTLGNEKQTPPKKTAQGPNCAQVQISVTPGILQTTALNTAHPPNKGIFKGNAQQSTYVGSK